MDDIYTQALLQISEEHTDLASRALRWITHSTRALYLDELAEIATVDHSSTGARFDPDERFRDPMDILSVCPSFLVTTTSPSPFPATSRSQAQIQQARLVDSSAKSFLESARLKAAPSPACQYGFHSSEAHATIATDCLAYLLQFNCPYTHIPETVQSSPLLRYAANYWAVHVRLAGEDKGAAYFGLARELFNSRIGFLNWTAFLDGYQPFNGTDPERRDVEAGFQTQQAPPPPLYYAALFGLSAVVEELLDPGQGMPNEPVRSRSDHTPSPSPLTAASLAGHADVVRLFLSRGVGGAENINAPDALGLGPPLILAASKGHTPVVRVLLEAGADVNVNDENGASALTVADRGGFGDVVKLLRAV
ncbi:ankyrin repeat protein [Aspergillus sp. HF37]|nr:ankyrin repeat protein [Aspergillus sp. HF37]